MAIDKLYSIKETAMVFGGVSERAVRKWLESGRLKPTHVGRRVMVGESAIVQFLEQSAKKAA